MGIWEFVRYEKDDKNFLVLVDDKWQS